MIVGRKYSTTRKSKFCFQIAIGLTGPHSSIVGGGVGNGGVIA
jgi:hypothetical protein